MTCWPRSVSVALTSARKGLVAAFSNAAARFAGKDPADPYLDSMMNEAPGPINFTMFLTLFGERLQGTDPEDVIKNAFACFDEENVGRIHEERLRELLTSMGDRFTDEDVSARCRSLPMADECYQAALGFVCEPPPL